MTTGVVTFDPALFKQQYPMFASVDNAVLQNWFDLATLVLNNSLGSAVQNSDTRQLLLYLLTAHITQLNSGVNGEDPSGLVGRINSATEGSVSVTTDMPDTTSSAWFMQTQWGATFWQMTSKWRRFRYVPGCPTPAPGPNFFPFSRRRW